VIRSDHLIRTKTRVTSGERRKALPNAWWCAVIRGSEPPRVPEAPTLERMEP
jgi:hypothetical protein